jgi:acetyl esterase/lipase
MSRLLPRRPACLGLAAVSGLGLLTLALLPAAARADEAARPEDPQVQEVKDLAYYDGADAHPVKHKLDLYLPKGQKDFPVLFFVHGGAWRHGDKNYLGVYRALGLFYARHGIGTVVTNYRLSPAVQHPEHVKDVARAFAWTHRNIGKYGGRADRVFVSGHSAGGHLVSLLATDEQYLKAEGLSRKDVRGVVSISGVYDIPEKILPQVFPADPEVRRQASPIRHAAAGLPPFLILYADNDLATCGRGPSEAFAAALKGKGNDVQTFEAKDGNHLSIIVSAAAPDDPVSRTILAFLDKHAKP